MFILYARCYRAHCGCQFIEVLYIRATDATRNKYVFRDSIYVFHPGEVWIIFFTYVDSEVERDFVRSSQKRVRRKARPREIVQRYIGVWTRFWKVTGIKEDGFLNVATLLSEIQMVHHVFYVLGGYLVCNSPYFVVRIGRGQQCYHASWLQKESRSVVEEPTRFWKNVLLEATVMF